MTQSPNRPRKLKDLLQTGEVQFTDAEKLEQNLPQIHDWLEARLAKEPFPKKRLGRPQKGEAREETEVMSFRLPRRLLVEVSARAEEFGVSRNRFVEEALINMVKEPTISYVSYFDGIQVSHRVGNLNFEGQMVVNAHLAGSDSDEVRKYSAEPLTEGFLPCFAGRGI